MRRSHANYPRSPSSSFSPHPSCCCIAPAPTTLQPIRTVAVDVQATCICLEGFARKSVPVLQKRECSYALEELSPVLARFRFEQAKSLLNGQLNGGHYGWRFCGTHTHTHTQPRKQTHKHDSPLVYPPRNFGGAYFCIGHTFEPPTLS